MAWTVGTVQDHAESTQARPLHRRPLPVLGLLGVVLGLGAAGLGVDGAGWASLVWVGALLVIAGVRGHLAARPPKDGPVFAISRLREGPVEVVGRIVPPTQALLSPLTGVKCCFYDYEVSLLDDASGERRPVDQRTQLSDFWLKDVTGSVWVRSEGLEIDMPRQLDEDLRTYDQTPRAVGERLQKLDIDPFVQPGVRRAIFIRETRLDPGDNVLLRAHGSRDVDGRLVLGKGPGPFSVERWNRATFVPIVPPEARRCLWAGVACVLAGVIGLLV